jgi:heat shock protein HslJ
MVGCETNRAPLTAPDTDPGNPVGSWVLQSFERSDGTLGPVPEPGQYTLELGEDGRAHIRADCNLCNSTYDVTGASLSFGLMACTLAACPPGSLEWDYRQALGSTSMFQVTGRSLALGYDGGILNFQAP